MNESGRTIRGVEFSSIGYRGFVINPGHQQYEALLARDNAACELAELWNFERRAIRTPMSTLWAWLRGAP